MNGEIEWRDLPGWEGLYQISDMGLIKSIGVGRGRKTGRIMPSYRDPYGYMRVRLYNHNKRHFMVHRLVMLAFVGECPAGKNVNHIDGDKANNHLSNLEYVTQRENVLHSIYVTKKAGRARGERNAKSKLTAEQVREIRRKRAAGEAVVKLSKAYGVSCSSIYWIVVRKSWSHVD